MTPLTPTTPTARHPCPPLPAPSPSSLSPFPSPLQGKDLLESLESLAATRAIARGCGGRHAVCNPASVVGSTGWPRAPPGRLGAWHFGSQSEPETRTDKVCWAGSRRP